MVSRLGYDVGMRARLRFVFSCVLPVAVWAQPRTRTPRFEDYPVSESFQGTPATPNLLTPEERRFRTVIREGVAKGYRVVDQPGGKERPGPNFAGHYFIVTWGCGSPCLMAAIVDAKSGRVLPPPFHHGPGHSYFQVPWAFPMEPPLNYRVNSRLLIAKVCEKNQSEECGTYYLLIGDNGFRLLSRTLGK